MTTTQARISADELHGILWDLAAEHSGQDRAELKPENRLNYDLGADSLTIAELTLELEDRLGVTVPEEVMDNPELTLGHLEEALRKLCCYELADKTHTDPKRQRGKSHPR